MQLRLAFAVMAHLETEVVLIDEALSVGDEDFRERCVQRIRQMAARGTTIVIVSHELQMMANLCDLALILDHGHLRAFDSASQVVASYLDTYHRKTPVSTLWQ